jgi:hypothetical protein
MAEQPRRIELDEWKRRLAVTKVSKEDLNRLVLNFLVIEGHKDTAEKFARGARLDVHHLDMAAIADRMAIRSAVHGGGMDTAIARLNDMNPEILETNPSLLFRIKQQRLIELIRASSVSEALDFVQDEMAALCEGNTELLAHLENTLALLAFDLDVAPPAAASSAAADAQGQASAAGETCTPGKKTLNLNPKP